MVVVADRKEIMGLAGMITTICVNYFTMMGDFFKDQTRKMMKKQEISLSN